MDQGFADFYEEPFVENGVLTTCMGWNLVLCGLRTSPIWSGRTFLEELVDDLKALNGETSWWPGVMTLAFF